MGIGRLMRNIPQINCGYLLEVSPVTWPSALRGVVNVEKELLSSVLRFPIGARNGPKTSDKATSASNAKDATQKE